MNHETISYKNLIQELSVKYNRLTLSYTNQQIHVPIPVSRQLASSAQILAIRILTTGFKLPSLHMLISISTACVIKSQLIAKLSLSPVISKWVSNGFDMHVVNRGESSVACEFTD